MVLVSSVLKDMLSLDAVNSSGISADECEGTTGSKSKTGLPIVDHETYLTMIPLLRIAHRLPRLSLDSFDQWFAMVVAADKYCMSELGIKSYNASKRSMVSSSNACII